MLSMPSISSTAETEYEPLHQVPNGHHHVIDRMTDDLDLEHFIAQDQ